MTSSPETSTSFLDDLSGGVAGGLIGGVVFRAIGPQLGMDAEADGYGQGVVGILDLLFLALAGYAVLRWWLSRRRLD